jgi:hypothetical protein
MSRPVLLRRATYKVAPIGRLEDAAKMLAGEVGSAIYDGSLLRELQKGESP